MLHHRESYAFEKLGSAVDSMATSASTIQDRLFNAFMIFHPVREDDFQEQENAELWRSIHDQLTAVRDGPEANGYVKNTLDFMSDEMAEKIAEDIVTLAGRLERKARGI